MCVAMMIKKFGNSAVPVQLPIGKEDSFSGVIDLVGMKAYRYNEEDFGATVNESKYPTIIKTQAARFREEMLEKVCDFNDELMHQIIEDRTPEEKQIKAAIRAGVLAGKISPVFCGSAFKNKGVQNLIDAVLDYLPSPLDRGKVKGWDFAADREETRSAERQSNLSRPSFSKSLRTRISAGSRSRGRIREKSTRKAWCIIRARKQANG